MADCRHGGQYTKADVRARIASMAGKSDAEIDEGMKPAGIGQGKDPIGDNPALVGKMKDIARLLASVRSEVSAPTTNTAVYAGTAVQ